MTATAATAELTEQNWSPFVAPHRWHLPHGEHRDRESAIEVMTGGC
ncbi:MAG TPA: hypothetical protein VKT31_06060 [Solirubrobacteraceae bacterium]|nr:hypothetical protein [Solirubrobacteraceae bacterium]